MTGELINGPLALDACPVESILKAPCGLIEIVMDDDGGKAWACHGRIYSWHELSPSDFPMTLRYRGGSESIEPLQAWASRHGLTLGPGELPAAELDLLVGPDAYVGEREALAELVLGDQLGQMPAEARREAYARVDVYLARRAEAAAR